MMSPIPPQVLEGLSEQSKACIVRLQKFCSDQPDLSTQSPSGLAAVLVLLFERSGQIRVLLTTRSKLLRSHPGQTALPGGKVDDIDGDMVATAYREAFEEVGLPVDSPDVHTICMMEPFVSSSKLLVTPVVAFLTNLTILDDLKASPNEVARIFDHALQAFLDPTLVKDEALSQIGGEDWPYDTEFQKSTDTQVPSLGIEVYRMHRFRSCASPIKGLTSDIMIKVAQIAYGTETTYERYAPGQIDGFPAIMRLLDDSRPVLIERCEAPSSATVAD